MEEAVKRFLTVISNNKTDPRDELALLYEDHDGSGNGIGFGDNFGRGYGDGATGSGGGDRDGSGDGSGTGCGFGIGGGSGDAHSHSCSVRGIKSINGLEVHKIDFIPTVIYSVHQTRGFYYAKGAFLSTDLSLYPTFVARIGDFFAHGDTLRDAVRAAHKKYVDNRPLEEKLDEFVKAHPDLHKKYNDLFEWHHILTGSCEAGRRQWCATHGYNPTDSITIRTFIKKTRNDYGGEIIAELAKRYNIELS